MEPYDMTIDPEEHFENIEVILDYQRVIKCMFFALMLKREAMTSYKSLPRGFVDSWEKLCHQFTAHFNASRITTSTKDGGEHRGVVQEKSEPLQDYIEHFNKEAIQVPEVNKLIDHI
jgi:hypothetical protein